MRSLTRTLSATSSPGAPPPAPACKLQVSFRESSTSSQAAVSVTQQQSKSCSALTNED
jgi:hypothetical protein